METLSLLEREALEILKQLQYRCDQFELFNKKKEGESGVQVEILADEIKIPPLFKEKDRLLTLYTIAKYLEGKGLNFTLTPKYINNNPSSQVYEGGDYDVIGIIKGESIQDIKAKIEELIADLQSKEAIQRKKSTNIMYKEGTGQLAVNGEDSDAFSGKQKDIIDCLVDAGKDKRVSWQEIHDKFQDSVTDQDSPTKGELSKRKRSIRNAVKAINDRAKILILSSKKDLIAAKENEYWLQYEVGKGE